MMMMKSHHQVLPVHRFSFIHVCILSIIQTKIEWTVSSSHTFPSLSLVMGPREGREAYGKGKNSISFCSFWCMCSEANGCFRRALHSPRGLCCVPSTVVVVRMPHGENWAHCRLIWLCGLPVTHLRACQNVCLSRTISSSLIATRGKEGHTQTKTVKNRNNRCFGRSACLVRRMDGLYWSILFSWWCSISSSPSVLLAPRLLGSSMRQIGELLPVPHNECDSLEEYTTASHLLFVCLVFHLSGQIGFFSTNCSDIYALS